MLKKTLILVPALAVLLLAFKKEMKITVWMIGDSTMSVKKEKAYPETGWGMSFATLFNDKVSVQNRAQNGRSTRSFISEHRWADVLDSLHAGDYVIIEFGHNDEKTDKPKVGTSLEVYRDNLAMFVLEARKKKAIPVLMTPIARRKFTDGVLTDTHKGYSGVVRHLSDSLKVPMVDMLRKTETLLSGLGDEKSVALFNYVDSGHVNYPKGNKDDTHLSPEGAKAIALLAADGLRELKLPLVSYLK